MTTKTRRLLLTTAVLALSASLSARAEDEPSWWDKTTSTIGGIVSGAADSAGGVVGTTGKLLLAAVRRGCGDSPYDGLGLIQTVQTASSYVDGAVRGYGSGIELTGQALGSKTKLAVVLLQDFSALSSDYRLDRAFASFETAGSLGPEAEMLKRRFDTNSVNGLDPQSLEALQKAQKWLYVGNQLQVDATLGMILLASVAADTQQGGADKLAAVLQEESRRYGSTEDLRQMSKSPQSMMSLVSNLGTANELNGAIENVTKFDAEDAAERDLGVTGALSGFKARVREQVAGASKGAGQADDDYQPSGAIVSSLLVDYLSTTGVNAQVAGVAVQAALMSCSGVFAPSEGAARTAAATSGGGEDKVLVKRVQAALIELGRLGGKADGIPGPKTRAAVIGYREANGLGSSERIDQALLDHLSRGKVAPVVTPAAPKGLQEWVSGAKGLLGLDN